MKTHMSVAVMCTFLILWCFALAEAGSADWKALRQSTYGDTFSYDAASVKHSGSNTVTVRAGTQSSEYLYEMDCKNRKARLVEGAGAAGSGWFTIAGGEDALLYRAVCP